jgi:hypothetical protein
MRAVSKGLVPTNRPKIGGYKFFECFQFKIIISSGQLYILKLLGSKVPFVNRGPMA